MGNIRLFIMFLNTYHLMNSILTTASKWLHTLRQNNHIVIGLDSLNSLRFQELCNSTVFYRLNQQPSNRANISMDPWCTQRVATSLHTALRRPGSAHTWTLPLALGVWAQSHWTSLTHTPQSYSSETLQTTQETHTGSLLTYTSAFAASRGKYGQRWMYRHLIIDDKWAGICMHDGKQL